MAELEALVAEFQKDQARIEAGIIEALRKLDSFEDSVHEAVSTKAAKPALSAKPAHESPASPTAMQTASTPTASAAPQAIEPALEPVMEPGSEPDAEPVADGADALDLF